MPPGGLRGLQARHFDDGPAHRALLEGNSRRMVYRPYDWRLDVSEPRIAQAEARDSFGRRWHLVLRRVDGPGPSWAELCLVRDQPRQHALLRIRLVFQGCRDPAGDDRPPGAPAVAQLVHPPRCALAVEAAAARPAIDDRRLRVGVLVRALA